MTRWIVAALALWAGTARAEPMTEQQCHAVHGEFIEHLSANGLPACAGGAFTEIGVWQNELSPAQMEAVFDAYKRAQRAECDNQTWWERLWKLFSR
jgi:hypothetical protein